MTKEEIEIYFLLWVNAFHPEFLTRFGIWRKGESVDDYLSHHTPGIYIASAIAWLAHREVEYAYWEHVNELWQKELRRIDVYNLNTLWSEDD